VNRPALAGLGPALVGALALAGLRAGFSRFRLFRDLNFLYSPAISGMQTGFSRFAMLFEKFIDLGGNSKKDSMIPREIQGIGARKFVAM
jgi:hypothetical protein